MTIITPQSNASLIILVTQKKKSKPWFSNDILTALKTRDYYYKKTNQYSDSIAMKSRRKEAVQDVKQKIREPKKTFYAVPTEPH